MCLEKPETLKHLLLECRFAQKIWTFIDNKILKFHSYPITPDIKLQLAIPRKLHFLENLLTFLITTTRHAIWKTRNQTYYVNRLTTPDQVIKSIIRSMKYNTMESRKTTSIYADILQMLIAEIEKS